MSFITNCHNRTIGCTQFKTGNYYGFFKEKEGKYYIKRTDSLQIETDSLTGKAYRNRIKWLNDCEYTLTSLGPTTKESDSIDYYLTVDPIKVSIIKYTPDYYIALSHIKNQTTYVATVDTIFIIHN